MQMLFTVATYVGLFWLALFVAFAGIALWAVVVFERSRNK